MSVGSGCGCYCSACLTGIHGCLYPACMQPTIGLANAWPKACGCGRSYTEHEWSLLKFVGSMQDDDPPLELRNCACGSTIAQEIETDAAAPTERDPLQRFRLQRRS